MAEDIICLKIANNLFNINDTYQIKLIILNKSNILKTYSILERVFTFNYKQRLKFEENETNKINVRCLFSTIKYVNISFVAK